VTHVIILSFLAFDRVVVLRAAAEEVSK